MGSQKIDGLVTWCRFFSQEIWLYETQILTCYTRKKYSIECTLARARCLARTDVTILWLWSMHKSVCANARSSTKSCSLHNNTDHKFMMSLTRLWPTTGSVCVSLLIFSPDPGPTWSVFKALCCSPISSVDLPSFAAESPSFPSCPSPVSSFPGSSVSNCAWLSDGSLAWSSPCELSHSQF